MTRQEVADGWCEACGKKLPPGVPPRPRRRATAHPQTLRGEWEGSPGRCGFPASAAGRSWRRRRRQGCGWRALWEGVARPALAQAGGGGETRPEPGRSRLTALGWAFLLLAAVAVATTTLAFDALGLERGPSRKLVRLLLGAGSILVVGTMRRVRSLEAPILS